MQCAAVIISLSLTNTGEVVTVAPGGMREALRTTAERYQIQWDDRLGFVRIAYECQVPVILAACPKADDLYDVYPSHTTKWFYQQLRVPIFFARGVGLTMLPRPVTLTHYLSPAFPPPPWDDDAAVRDERIAAFHAMLVAEMKKLMAGEMPIGSKKT